MLCMCVYRFGCLRNSLSGMEEGLHEKYLVSFLRDLSASVPTGLRRTNQGIQGVQNNTIDVEVRDSSSQPYFTAIVYTKQRVSASIKIHQKRYKNTYTWSIKGEPNVGIQYIVNYFITTVYLLLGPPCPKKSSGATALVGLGLQSGRRRSAKLVPTFADRGASRGQSNGSPRPLISVYRTWIATYSIEVAPQLTSRGSRGWVHPVPDLLPLRKIW